MEEERSGWSPITIIILIIALGVLLFSGWKLVSIFLEYKRGTDEYKAVSETYVQPVEGEREPDFDVDFTALLQENADVVAWIYFPHMDINYPVMQSDNNSYYLKHTFNKERNGAGSIFMEMLNNPLFTDRNTMIYGHNMKNGSMFGLLKKFREEEDFYKDNTYFYISTPLHGWRKYDIFSYYVTRKKDTYVVQFEDDAALADYTDKVKALSMIDFNVTTSIEDDFVMLVTCTSRVDDERFVIHAKQDKRWQRD